jgi:hypothetical protein
MAEKFQENLDTAVKSLQIADHIAYITYPVVNEKRLLIKIFDEVYKSIISSINAILNYEAFCKRITLYENNKANMQLFIDKLSELYNISPEQIKKILEIIRMNHTYKQSAMEFVKKDKLIILSDNLTTRSLDIHKIKEYLLLAKEVLMKTHKKINESATQS